MVLRHNYSSVGAMAMESGDEKLPAKVLVVDDA